MKKLVLSICLTAILSVAQAQFQVNPKMGVTYQHMTDNPDMVDYEAAIGWQVGTDLRIGDRVFFQPGAMFGQNTTIVSFKEADQVVHKDNLIRTTLKLKALGGYRIVDGELFDLRIMAGPTYDVLLSVDNKDDNIDWNKGDFNEGSFNIDAGLGFDMGWFTLEPSISFGISKAFKETENFENLSSRYLTYGLTVGLNFGNDD